VDIVEWMFCVDPKIQATAAFMAGLGSSQQDPVIATGIEVAIAIAGMHGCHSRRQWQLAALYGPRGSSAAIARCKRSLKI
jgi:hypothetical protein